jgi:hypothetical protein
LKAEYASVSNDFVFAIVPTLTPHTAADDDQDVCTLKPPTPAASSSLGGPLPVEHLT